VRREKNADPNPDPAPALKAGTSAKAKRAHCPSPWPGHLRPVNCAAPALKRLQDACGAALQGYCSTFGEPSRLVQDLLCFRRTRFPICPEIVTAAVMLTGFVASSGISAAILCPTHQMHQYNWLLQDLGFQPGLVPVADRSPEPAFSELLLLHRFPHAPTFCTWPILLG